MLRHSYSASVELNTFRFKAKPLFKAGLTGQSNSSASGQHTMPRQSVGLPQCPHYLARGAWKSSSASHGAVGRNFAAWNFKNRFADLHKH